MSRLDVSWVVKIVNQVNVVQKELNELRRRIEQLERMTIDDGK